MRNGICWLCGEVRDLHNSHIIPKFVFRWLIKSGGTPYIRHGERPNLRVQDGDKHPLFCTQCESLLSAHEKAANNHVFLPATRRERLSGRYGPWLSRFAASLALRTLQSQEYREIDKQYSPAISAAAEVAKESWRKFLLGRERNPGENRLYMIYPGYFDGFDAEGLPANWNTYAHRSVERDMLFCDDDRLCYTFTKIGPLVFLGRIIDLDRKLNKYHLQCSDGFFDTNPTRYLKVIWGHLLERANKSLEIFDNISPTQKLLSEGEVLKRVSEFERSELFRTLSDDRRQFGDR